MIEPGTFFGVGVGPGPQGFIPVAALEALHSANIILLPRGKDSDRSVAEQCIRGLTIDSSKLREVIYNMSLSKDELKSHYQALAQEIAVQLRAGHNVAYLTLGDSLTYSTYGYALQSLQELLPDAQFRTFPGITSYAALASATGFPLGQGKEKTLILPCPDTAPELRQDIETHDIVVLMKIGRRLSMVLELLNEMSIASYCALASRIGLPGELICADVSTLDRSQATGYFTTMLIRKSPCPFVNSEVGL